MKHVAARYFLDTETHFKDQQAAKDFDALLLHLEKLHAIGQFRNKFIMGNQQLILEDKVKAKAGCEGSKMVCVYKIYGLYVLFPYFSVTLDLSRYYL